MQRLPLFPLQTVLFPGAQLPLHIFEPRYRLMISRCIQQEKPFGVVLIREGEEVGGSATPHLVGTLATIDSAYRLADDRLYIMTSGQQRFRINYPLAADPYMVAMVTLLDDDAGDEQAARDVLSLCEQYRTSISAATGMRSDPFDLPTDAVQLSYALADQMVIELAIKQHLLEATTDERLQTLTEMINLELSLLPPLTATDLRREPPLEHTSWN